MKERLTGAIILVALIVLLVPELLTGPLRPKSAPDASAAARAVAAAHAEPPLRSYTLTLSATPAVSAAAAASAAQPPAQPPRDAADSSAVSSAQEAASRHSAAVAVDDPAPQASTPHLPQPSAGVESGLQAAKLPAHPEVGEVRASASSGGWVVQLGSFASRENANRLAHALERRGFRMSVSSARAGARVLWRVRAGPAHDRAGAQRLAARLGALGHRGELLPVK